MLYQCQNDEFGCFYCYKRPNLDTFLLKLQKHGQVSVFSHNPASFSDVVLDQIDPQGKYFRHRFYLDACKQNTDGSWLKDMSVIDKLIQDVD
jgi:TFIIF-interacting CTD phosphatase-like protein